MSKTWYPVINYEKCIECGACVDWCEHGVYNTAKAPRPVVVYPEGCVHGCRGCASQCPTGAIEYAGDTGEDTEACDCGCDCGCVEGDDEEEGSCGCGCGDNNEKSPRGCC